MRNAEDPRRVKAVLNVHKVAIYLATTHKEFCEIPLYLLDEETV